MEPTVLAHSPTIHTWWNWSAPFPSIPPIPGCPLASRGERDFVTCWQLLWLCPHPSSDSPRAWQAGRKRLLGVVCAGWFSLNVPQLPGWTKRFAQQNEDWVSPQQRGTTIVGRAGEAGTGRRADQAAAQATCRARMQTESLLASFFHAQVVDADKHSGTSRSDALLRPEARGGPGQPNRSL